MPYQRATSLATMAFFKLRLLLGACWAVPAISLTVPSKASWFQQKVSHFSASNATYLQRYYMDDKHRAGPGSPIFVIMGGEGLNNPLQFSDFLEIKRPSTAFSHHFPLYLSIYPGTMTKNCPKNHLTSCGSLLMSLPRLGRNLGPEP